MRVINNDPLQHLSERGLGESLTSDRTVYLRIDCDGSAIDGDRTAWTRARSVPRESHSVGTVRGHDEDIRHGERIQSHVTSSRPLSLHLAVEFVSL